MGWVFVGREFVGREERGWGLKAIGMRPVLIALATLLPAPPTNHAKMRPKSTNFGGVRMSSSRDAFSRSILAAAVSLSAGLATPAMAQGFEPGLHVYSPPPGFTWAGPSSLAEDGSAVSTGYFQIGTGSREWGVLIRPTGTTQSATESRFYDVSDNGEYASGYVSRYSLGGFVDTLIPGISQPVESELRSSISGDGSVVAGSIEDSSFSYQSAYRWTEQTGLQYLGGYRPGASFTRIYSVSRDGGTIVGRGSVSLFSDQEAWTWTQANGFAVLPDLADAPFTATTARAVNSDGTIIVGSGANPGFGSRGIVWRSDEILALPAIPGWRSAIATDLSDDGSIVVGTLAASLVGLPETAAVWTHETNWVPAIEYLRDQGADIPEYYTSGSGMHVSGDGQTFSGYIFDSRTSSYVIAVIVIPSPGALASLGMYMLICRRSRARRQV